MLTLLDTDTVFWLRFITDSSTQATSMPIHWNADIWLCKKCCGFVKQGKLKNPFMIDCSICREETPIKYEYVLHFEREWILKIQRPTLAGHKRNMPQTLTTRGMHLPNTEGLGTTVLKTIKELFICREKDKLLVHAIILPWTLSRRRN